MHPSQVKQNLNASTNNLSKALIELGVAGDRDEARIILAKVFEDKNVRFAITKAAVNAR